MGLPTAHSGFNIELLQVNGLTLMAKANSGHWIAFDADKDIGGADAASCPFEVFLASIAACTAIDVILILKKMKVKYDSFRINLHAARRAEHPKVPESISIEYIFEGDNIPNENIEKAISLSLEKYCSISAVVKMAGIPVEWSYNIISDANYPASN